MEKFLTSRKSPQVLIVEGFWGVGKSTLITRVLRARKICHISEPNHTNAGVSKDLSQWYRTQHYQRLELARKLVKNGESIILERSILSSLAFHYAKYSRVPVWFNHAISRLRELPNLRVLFLHNDKTSLRNVPGIKDNAVRSLILRDSKFYDRYVSFYTSVLPTHAHIKVMRIRAPNNLNNSHSVIKKIERKIHNILPSPSLAPQKHMGKKKVLCASVVLFYKKKFLVLYSHDYRYYVLPQGHKVAQEKHTDTALRETREETGFCDLKMVAPLGKYSYHYRKNNMFICKHIRVYLVQLKTLARRKKQLEPHEHYSNHFFTADDAIKKLRWPEDKQMVRRSEKIINEIK